MLVFYQLSFPVSVCPLTDLSQAILQSMQRSRRLLFVLSPDFLKEKSFSLLECRLGLYLQHSHQASIVAVAYHSVSKLPCVEVGQIHLAAVSTVKWRGSQSEPRRSRFWLRLRLALPVRPLALGRRLIDSTSSHSDLAALALQRVQQNQNQWEKNNRRNRQALAIPSHRDRQAAFRGRGSVKREGTRREEGLRHSSNCSTCAGFIGQVGDRGSELPVETEMQQVTHDRTEIRSDPVPETDPTLVPDTTHDTQSTPCHISISIPASDPVPDSAHPTHAEDNGGKWNEADAVLRKGQSKPSGTVLK